MGITVIVKKFNAEVGEERCEDTARPFNLGIINVYRTHCEKEKLRTYSNNWKD